MRRPLAVVTCAAVLALGGCSGEQDPGLMPAEPTDEPTGSVATGVPLPDGVEVTELPDGPVGLTVVGRTVWAALPQADGVWDGARVRPAGDLPLRLVSTPDGVWVSLIGEGALVRLDPRTGKEDLRVALRPADSEPEGLAYAAGVLWVVDQAGDRVVEVDSGTGEVLGEHPVGREPRLVTAGPAGVHVSAFTGAKVTRVAGGEATTRGAGSCLSPQGLAVAAGVLWVACTVDGQVVGLDARTLRPVAELPGLGGADAVVADGDTVYVVGQRGPTVWTIDAETHEVTGELVLGDDPPVTENVDAVLVGDRLVVSHPTARTLYGVPLALLR